MKTWADWEHIHQPYELDHWRDRGGIEWCADEQFHAWWGDVFSFMGGVDLGARNLDVGCGPRPPFGPGSTAIDPLIDEYKKLVPKAWWKDIDSHSCPAEELITDLTGEFNTVMCWNCIDHTIGWQQILLNLKAYGAKDATYAIATDFNRPGPGHPGFDRLDFLAEIDKSFKIVKWLEDFHDRHLAMVLKAR